MTAAANTALPDQERGSRIPEPDQPTDQARSSRLPPTALYCSELGSFREPAAVGAGVPTDSWVPELWPELLPDPELLWPELCPELPELLCCAGASADPLWPEPLGTLADATCLLSPPLPEPWPELLLDPPLLLLWPAPLWLELPLDDGAAAGALPEDPLLLPPEPLCPLEPLLNASLAVAPGTYPLALPLPEPEPVTLAA